MNGTRGLVIATAAAFIVGCSVGLMGGILFSRFVLSPRHEFGRSPGRPMIVRRFGHDPLLPMLERSLQLSPGQRERIVAILDRVRRAQHVARDSMHAEIARVLTPDQRVRWSEIEQRFERSRRSRVRNATPP